MEKSLLKTLVRLLGVLLLAAEMILMALVLLKHETEVVGNDASSLESGGRERLHK